MASKLSLQLSSKKKIDSWTKLQPCAYLIARGEAAISLLQRYWCNYYFS